MPPFDYEAPAELFLKSYGKKSAAPYRRFSRGAEALRFAIETFAGKHSQTLVLEQSESRFGWNDIGALYDSPDYPLRER